MTAISLKLPDALDRQLTRLARERKLSRSALIREALEAYAAQAHASVTVAAADLVGALEGPQDLSSNSAYLSDYGR